MFFDVVATQFFWVFHATFPRKYKIQTFMIITNHFMPFSRLFWAIFQSFFGSIHILQTLALRNFAVNSRNLAFLKRNHETFWKKGRNFMNKTMSFPSFKRIKITFNSAISEQRPTRLQRENLSFFKVALMHHKASLLDTFRVGKNLSGFRGKM